MKYCLACNNEIEGNDRYHKKCLKEFWEDDIPVLKLGYKTAQIEELAKENILQRVIVTGVQPKLSLGFTGENTDRLTIVGALNGRYILKPPSSQYPGMPENEALTMLLARACGIATVPFLLIPMDDGELAYLTRRIDRSADNKKFPMEDACQFTGRLTEHKYRGSHEKIARGLIAYTQNPLLEVVKFYQQVVVSFLAGNNDMHLKNFSIIAFNDNQYQLSPAYDMLAVNLVIPEDKDELALNLNGKKRKLTRKDFEEAMVKAHIPDKSIENLFKRIEKGIQTWPELIQNSFLATKHKSTFLQLVKGKASQIELQFNDHIKNS